MTVLFQQSEKGKILEEAEERVQRERLEFERTLSRVVTELTMQLGGIEDDDFSEEEKEEVTEG